jgi:hypothetical protein
MMKPCERVAGIKSKGDLVEFVRSLRDDLQTEPGAWENATLERYLSALASWLEDSGGYYQNQGRDIPVSPSWRDVAEMLMAAKMYE